MTTKRTRTTSPVVKSPSILVASFTMKLRPPTSHQSSVIDSISPQKRLRSSSSSVSISVASIVPSARVMNSTRASTPTASPSSRAVASLTVKVPPPMTQTPSFIDRISPVNWKSRSSRVSICRAVRLPSGSEKDSTSTMTPTARPSSSIVFSSIWNVRPPMTHSSAPIDCITPLKWSSEPRWMRMTSSRSPSSSVRT